eukprot:CAMPEP_0172481604 /NCGR_PEP_ID=MMETSP1066-20121228/7611_1 /TAXON_ID=671091 /ORGANISM="Coscinodiscus wailesii, Strain CCMP2513" /LENGTH=201 /DNA_ID=CAMNT_0013244061 /DNA_START=103 /DNA_END=705 /DNA_ORIENTATION=+
MSIPNLHNAFDEQPDEVFGEVFTFLELKDVVSFRMTRKNYYTSLQITYTNKHRESIGSNWREIYDCGGVDLVKQILAQDNKIEASKRLYNIACDQIDKHDTKGIPEDERTDLFLFLWKDLNMNPSVGNNRAIRSASWHNCINLVKGLLKDSRVDPAACKNEAIRRASENGHLNVVQELLKDDRVNPSADDNYAIRLASENG